ncbi:hypothetical protein CXG81DRAFT_14237 [Caulochytrium protostelioides]|uniref:TRASH domain-containing protein n=2 Tax=Caulochytrium protostelioides TaxID=1555241 RepID=A0A4P9X3N4_9FUNG|nr:hypothetical protein CXG81DRAFT_14237 [Caulochytrium protostelioides]|eukprot:RKO99646.1 hypothetical protein CXG81DRAFT_14237 [Caulochytrium protostelioides]
MRLEKCFFCSSNVYPGHGMMFVRNDSKIFRFCRSKCHRNFKLKRNPRKVRWTKAFRRTAGKDMTIDSTLEFEKRRNIPVRYDRDLMATTLKAMKRIKEIKARRESVFYRQRMAHKHAQEKAENQKLVDDMVDLADIPAEEIQQAMRLPEVSGGQRQNAMETA